MIRNCTSRMVLSWLRISFYGRSYLKRNCLITAAAYQTLVKVRRISPMANGGWSTSLNVTASASSVLTIIQLCGPLQEVSPIWFLGVFCVGRHLATSLRREPIHGHLVAASLFLVHSWPRCEVRFCAVSAKMRHSQLVAILIHPEITQNKKVPTAT